MACDAGSFNVQYRSEANPSLCEEVESGHTKVLVGWSKGANLLGKYIQWVYLPAIKDPTDELFVTNKRNFSPSAVLLQ